jgi:hypothetical protein
MLEFTIGSGSPVATLNLISNFYTTSKPVTDILPTLDSHDVTKHSSYYLETMGNSAQLKKVVDRSVRQIRKAIKDGHYPKLDAIACRGISGIIVASAVSIRLGVQLIVVRKTLDESHAESLIEGEPLTGEYTFICMDDFVCSGDTIRETCRYLVGKHVGNYLYRGDMYSNGVRVTTVKGDVGSNPVKKERKRRKSA